jgi:UDP-N-acetyl-D-galactosamine dehydrogenase
MIAAGSYIKGARVNVLGLTFKENCGDLRNSKVMDVVRELVSFGLSVHVHDPVATAADALREYGVSLVDWADLPCAGAVVAAVAHDELVARPLDEVLMKLEPGGVYVDIKCKADLRCIEERGYTVWRL